MDLGSTCSDPETQRRNSGSLSEDWEWSSSSQLLILVSTTHCWIMSSVQLFKLFLSNMLCKFVTFNYILESVWDMKCQLCIMFTVFVQSALGAILTCLVPQQFTHFYQYTGVNSTYGTFLLIINKWLIFWPQIWSKTSLDTVGFPCESFSLCWITLKNFSG